MESNVKSSTQKARFGLVITTLALGVALVVTGLLGYLGARQSSDTVMRARAADLIFSARRALFLAGDLSSEFMEDYLQDMNEQGIRFIGLAVRGEGFVQAAGALPESVPVTRWATCCQDAKPQVFRDGDVVVVAQSLEPRGRRGGRGGGPGRFHPGRWQRWQGRLLVLAFEPVVARGITGRALLALVTGLGAFAVLMAAAVFFWRLSARADRYAAQLNQDRQLKMLGEMSAVLGHEIRNPLASLKGHAQLLVEKLAGQSARSGAERVVTEALRLEEITGHVLDFARSGSLDLAPADPAALARSAAEAVDPDRIRVSAAQELPAWVLDGPRMEQVLVNLLRNALQASPAQASVELDLLAKGSQLVFSIRDRGEGIAPGQEKRIFEPFFTGRVRGTGLGLALAKRIVEEHGGSIDARNHDDGGAVFQVTLPVRTLEG